MGGDGSGRKPDVLKSMLTQQAQQVNTIANNGENLVIPNYSGIQKAALVTSPAIAAGTLSGAGVINAIPYYVTPTQLSGANIYFSGNNVGIGKIPTTSKLDVSGDINSSAAVNANYGVFTTYSTAGYFSSRLSNADTILRLGSNSYDLSFQDANSVEKMILQGSTGNLGIGITSPTEKLHLSGGSIFTSGGNISTTGNFSGANLYVTGIVSGANFFASSAMTGSSLFVSNNIKAGTDFIWDNSLSMLGIGKSPGGTAAIDIEGSSNQRISIKDTTNNVITILESTNSNGRMGTTSAHGFQIIAGNNDVFFVSSDPFVGIGTSSPVKAFEVTTNTGGILTIRRNDVSINANDMVGKLEFYTNDTSTTTNFIVADIEAQATNTITTDINPGCLIFRTTGTAVAATPSERVRIDNAGNVGIGTTTPTSLLHLSGGNFVTSGNISGAGYYVGSLSGANGSFTTTDLKTITVTNGLITAVV